MSALKIDLEAIRGLKARAEAHGPLDADEIARDTMRGGRLLVGHTITISPGFFCVYAVETGYGMVYDHLTVSSKFPGLSLTPDIVDQIAAAFGLGEQKTWDMQFELMGGQQIVKIRR